LGAAPLLSAGAKPDYVRDLRSRQHTDDLLGSTTLQDGVDHMDGVVLGDAELRFSYEIR